MTNERNPNIQKLVELSDPDYFGIYFTRNLFTIITLLFSLLFISILAVVLTVHIDMTIKANVLSVERCVDKNTTCVTLLVSNNNLALINLGDVAHIKVASKGTYSNYIIDGRVVSRKESDNKLTGELPSSIEVELTSSGYDQDKLEIKFGLIVVKSRPVLDVLIESLPQTALDIFNIDVG